MWKRLSIFLTHSIKIGHNVSWTEVLSWDCRYGNAVSASILQQTPTFYAYWYEPKHEAHDQSP